MRTLDDVPLAPAERQAIEAAAAALRARFPVTEIVLFGSKARGDSEPESDIDLLVLTARKLDWQEERTILHELFDIGMRFDVVFSPLTVEAGSWRDGVHSVLPIHTEVEREGVRCGLQGDEPPADGTPPPSDQVPSAPASREALVKQVAGEWMGMADEALASARAEVDAQRWRSAINRAYYAAFYAASAVLLSRGRHFVKHAGLQTALHRDLVHP
jgi:predicted nucleotidyltransferase